MGNFRRHEAAGAGVEPLDLETGSFEKGLYGVSELLSRHFSA